ncbi:hypothetical protein ACES2L_01705 [Bdellovibrio bacteriovorus]
MARRFSVVIFLILLGVVVLYLSRTNDKSASIVHPKNDSKSVPPIASVAERVKEEAVQSTEVASTSSSAPIVSQRTPRKLPPPRRVSSLPLENAELEKIPLLADTPWKLWKGVVAKPRTSANPNEVVISQVSGFVVVASEVEYDLKNFFSDSPLVVANTRLSQAGVLTGTINVILKEGQSADFLNEENGVKIVGAFPKIRTYYVTALQEPFDLPAFYLELKNHQGVEQASLEILSRQYDKF